MAYRDESGAATECVLVDERGREVASFDIETDGSVLQIEVGHGLTDVTTDEEPEGVHVFMLIPQEV
ncbi:MAG: hypothetical protein QGD89_09190 [Actinomycetota bacterium]|nr:hypothetical protein [Actinomycetota bacterium]